MDVGGSPFPYKDGISMDGGTTLVTGTVGFGACSSDMMEGSSTPGSISPGSVLGNATIPHMEHQGCLCHTSLFP